MIEILVQIKSSQWNNHEELWSFFPVSLDKNVNKKSVYIISVQTLDLCTHYLLLQNDSVPISEPYAKAL